jgi:hypothetical protein
MWRSAIGPARVPRGRWLPVVMAVTAAGLAACGEDGGGANSAATTRRTTSTDRATRSEKIVIKEHANLQGVVDKGEVLKGSSLGGAPFCQGGRFTGAHDNAMIYRTFKCPNGVLRIGFTPGNGTGQTVSGRWKILGGTGPFKGMKGSGRIQTRFAAGSQPAEAREALTGSVVR